MKLTDYELSVGIDRAARFNHAGERLDHSDTLPVLTALEELRDLRHTAGELADSLSELHSWCDQLMGDTDPSDPEDPLLLAMQRAAKLIDGQSFRG